MEIYNAITTIVVLTAIFGYLNYKYIKLPRAIGIMLISIAASLLIVGLGKVLPEFFDRTINAVSNIDFDAVVLKVMLSFLLFAAAIQTDLAKLKKERNPIIAYATISVILSSAIVGIFTYWMITAFGIQVNFLYCLLFGTLISPTDPVAVSAILKRSDISESVKTKISGESLLNDGIAVVLFITVYDMAQTGIGNITLGGVGLIFLREVVGGIALGWALGKLASLMLRSFKIEDTYVVEVMITLAVVMGGYNLAEVLGVSGPLTMVLAGLILRGTLIRESSDVTKDYIGKFWQMIDEVMNAVLFLLIGFEMLIVPFNNTLLLMGIIAAIIVLFARLLSVSFPIFIIRNKKAFATTTIPILTWGAMRGGISVALALSVPKYMYGGMFVTITYIVVILSIVVQGLTIERLSRRLTSGVT